MKFSQPRASPIEIGISIFISEICPFYQFMARSVAKIFHLMKILRDHSIPRINKLQCEARFWKRALSYLLSKIVQANFLNFPTLINQVGFQNWRIIEGKLYKIEPRRSVCWCEESNASIRMFIWCKRFCKWTRRQLTKRVYIGNEHEYTNFNRRIHYARVSSAYLLIKSGHEPIHGHDLTPMGDGRVPVGWGSAISQQG